MLRRTVISARAAAAVVLPALPGSALGLTEACAVRNVDTGRNFTSIAAAVSAATRGQELTVRGTCFEDLVLKKSITLRGVPTTLTPRAQISSASGPTILVDGSASVVIRDLDTPWTPPPEPITQQRKLAAIERISQDSAAR